MRHASNVTGLRKILVRDGKGAKDRVTMLPESPKALLQDHCSNPGKTSERSRNFWGTKTSRRRCVTHMFSTGVLEASAVLWTGFEKEHLADLDNM
jgi:hypothetical protein